MIGSGSCLAQAVDRLPSPVLQMASQLVSAAPLAANAAATSRITVLSTLGQPLRAELDIAVSREELVSLAARMGPAEAFRWAGAEYAPVLSAVRFTLDKHPDGKPYFRIETDQAVNDPFLDLLVELNWSSGRLVRKYTLLLDPSGQGTGAVIVAEGVPVKPMASADTASPAGPMATAGIDSSHLLPQGSPLQPDSGLAKALATSPEQACATPCSHNPLVLAQARIPSLQPNSAQLMSDVYTPLLETAESACCEVKPMLLAQADTTLAARQAASSVAPRPGQEKPASLPTSAPSEISRHQDVPMQLALADVADMAWAGIQPASAAMLQPGQGKSAPVSSTPSDMSRQDAPLQLARADTQMGAIQVALAAAPRSGRGESALVMSASPSVPELNANVQLAQADTTLAGIQVASAAAPRTEQGAKSALVSSAPADTAQPRRNRASATANMKLAQGPANGNGKSNGVAKAGEIGSGLWQIPPIRWGGEVSFDLMTNTSQGGPRTTQVFETVAVHADSYIYQPWFARVNGGLRLMKLNNGLTKRLATEDGGTTTVTGDGSLNLFPVSRFPFTASYAVSDSKTSGSLVPNGYTSRLLSLNQSYAPLAGSANYSLHFDRSTVTSDFGGTDIANSLTGMMNDHGDFSDYHINFGHYTNDLKRSGNSSEIDNINAIYNYRPDANLSINNLVNLGRSKFELSGPSPDSSNRYFQASSFATWRPGQNSPLMVSGGARWYESTSGAGGAETDSRTVSGNAAASYTFNRNVMLTAAGMLTETRVNDIDGRQTYLSGEANYNADPIRFGEYNYGWGGAAYTRYQGQSGINDESHGTSGARIRHNINRTFWQAENSSLQGYASQSLSKDTGYLSYMTLTTDGGVSWNLRPSESTSTMLGANVADTRSKGEAGTRQHFQMINLQANGQVSINRYSSGGANMTIQGTRQVTNTFMSSAQNDGFNWHSNGNLYYQHMRAFDVPMLRYSATFNVNQFRNQSRLDGNIDAPIERVNKSFEQRFDYDIGRTALQLQMRYADIEGRNSSMIYFRVVRQFGE